MHQGFIFVADEHGRKESVKPFAPGECGGVAPNADDPFCLDESRIPFGNDKSISIELGRHETAGESVTAKNQRVLFGEHCRIDFAFEGSVVVVDFDDVHVRDSFPDVFEDERIGVAHVRENDSCCVHVFFELLVNS